MQKIIQGFENAAPLFERKKFFLVRGGAYDRLEIRKILNKYPHTEFTDFTPNPTYEQLRDGVHAFNRADCEMIVAVGGGSAIDIAKCIKLYSGINDDVNYLKQTPKDTRIPLIAVPTTAGTGSESTRHAVIYCNGEKQSISHNSIMPNYAVLEPAVLKSLPLYQKKCALLDALCQGIESWWSVKSTNESIEYSKASIGAIKANWEEYIFENTEAAAGEILQAANLAGLAINITATTAAHAMSYKITSLYKLPHGHAVAVCMPEVWRYILNHAEECIDARGDSYLKATLKQITEMISLDYFNAMIQRLEMNSPASKDKETEAKLLAAAVNSERLKNTPVILSHETLQEMYAKILRQC